MTDKELNRKINQMNNTLKILSSETQSTVGVMAAQQDDNCLKTVDNLYMKIYTISSKEFTQKKKELLFRVLLDECSEFRYRFTQVHKGTDIFLLTVYYEAFNYYEAFIEFEKFEAEVIGIKLRRFGIPQITTCQFDQLFSLIAMNVKGQMKQYDVSELINRKANWNSLLFEEMNETESVCYKNIDKHAYVFCDTRIFEPDVQESMQLKGNYIQCIDFQKLSDKDIQLFNITIARKYNHKVEFDELINCSYMICCSGENEEELKCQVDQIVKENLKRGVILEKPIGNQIQAYKSICSFGLFDYHSRKNFKFKQMERLI